MSDSSHLKESQASSASSLRLESASGEFVLIPQAVSAETVGEESNSLDLGNLLAILRRRMRLALGILVTTVGLGAALTLYQRLLSPVYEGDFILLVGDPVNSLVESQSSGSGSELKDLALQSSRMPNVQISQDLIDVLKSPLLLKPVAKRMGIDESKIDSNLKILRHSGDTSNVLDVSLKWYNPKEGQQILELLRNAYLGFSINQRRERLSQSISYLEEQAPALQNRLAVLQGQLSDFRTRNRFLDPSTEGDVLVKRLQDLDDRQNELQRKEAELNALAAEVRSGNLSSQQIPGVGQQLSTASKAKGSVDARSGSSLDQLQTDLTQLEKELVIAEATFQPASPIVKSLQARINRVKPFLQQRQLEAVTATLKQINGEQAEIKRQQIELKQMFNLNPTLIKQNEAIQQRLELAKANLTAYIKAKEDFRLLVAQRTVPWKVISPPTFKDKLSKPNIGLNLLFSMLLGVGAGGGAAFILDKMENVFYTSREVEQAIGLPLLGSLPFQPIGLDHDIVGRVAMMGTEEGYSLRESLRNLYTNVRLLRTDKSRRLIAITSTLQGEGKSTLIVLFAQTLSDLGKRVLVVDADLRQPMLHSYFGVENVNGLSTLLSEVSSVPEQFIQPARDKLHLLTAGPTPSDPPSLLSSERFAIVVEQIRALKGYDYVLFDISPAMELSDPLLISENLDGILFLVSLGLVHRDLPAQALRRIQSTGIEVLGVVSNDVMPLKTTTLAMVMDLKRRIPTLYEREGSAPCSSGIRRSYDPDWSLKRGRQGMTAKEPTSQERLSTMHPDR